MADSAANVTIIGAGPAGLMAAEVIARGGASVTIYERMASPGRKFLMAGRGGLNLTHSEDLEIFLDRYGEAAQLPRRAVEAFPPAAVQAWCEELGQPVFTGSTGRVFPQAMKSSPLLRAWLRRLAGLGVTLKPRHCWRGWDDSGALLFAAPDGGTAVRADAAVLALGGASWPRLGSDGGWVPLLAAAGIAISPLKPSNCGFITAWSEVFRDRFAGQPLKGIALHGDGVSARGEILITASGLEGGAIYALSPRLRDTIAASGEAAISVDLRPDVPLDRLAQQFAVPRGKQSLASFLRKAAHLSPAAMGLLHEAALAGGQKLAALTPPALAALIKAVPVRLTATAPLAKAISTAGGIALEELDERFMIRRRPGLFAAGEMLDWEAPTGGYLLQGCFSTGAAAGRGVLDWLRERGWAGSHP